MEGPIDLCLGDLANGILRRDCGLGTLKQACIQMPSGHQERLSMTLDRLLLILPIRISGIFLGLQSIHPSVRLTSSLPGPLWHGPLLAVARLARSHGKTNYV